MTTEDFLISAWDWNPWVIAVVAVGSLIYGIWEGFRFTRKIGWFLAGLAVFFVTLVSPIDALADGYLFCAHMMQHLLLLLIVPFLILLGLTSAPDNGDLHQHRGKWLDRIWCHPVAAWISGVGGMWLWHAPALCNAAVTSITVHRLQYASLLIMGTAYWWPVVGPSNKQRLPPLTGIIYLFTACVGCTVLGVIITFAPVEICSVYLHPVDRLGILPLIQNQWGLTPAKDQQIGGLLMWVPACFVYFFGILGLFGRWHGGAFDEAAIPGTQLNKTIMEKPNGH